MVKCHSYMFDSRGAACRVGSGCAESSEASFSMRLTVGDLVLNVGSAITVVIKASRPHAVGAQAVLYHMSCLCSQ